MKNGYLKVYHMKGCPYCQRLLKFLHEKRAPIKTIDIEADGTFKGVQHYLKRDGYMHLAGNHSTVPAVVYITPQGSPIFIGTSEAFYEAVDCAKKVDESKLQSKACMAKDFVSYVKTNL